MNTKLLNAFVHAYERRKRESKASLYQLYHKTNSKLTSPRSQDV